MTGGFRSLHPLAAALYFSGLVLFVMWLVHPAYLLAAGGCLLLLHLQLDGGAALGKAWKGYLAMGALVALANPLVSTRGATILGYLGNRPVTLESCVYGLLFGLTLSVMLLGFGAARQVITLDRFLYLTGTGLPRTAFVIVMVLRLVPLLKRRLREIAAAAKTQGRLGGGKRTARIREAMELLNTLVVWTLEESLHMAVAMRASGYGSGPRSTFAAYRMEGRDKGVLVLLGGLALPILAGSLWGRGQMVFYPLLSGLELHLPHYGAFLFWCALPILMNIGETLQWQIIKSKT
ncbi:energy-coupling factor transporter transmembrane component T [Anaerotalea alkaliphila]|uniref:Energy-coupling factor transport system permease protein n=1 Tax=Anaerotalea alkaliphila TaxID=2662126 RepID=A0A7X5HV26_9FIRM|nr:energy-coupling factor transporter transmembrane component T [Anaerotalea alkaliphila]NDL67180.1 hypothetical protein [Anaerotalea alkaliphila]